MLRIIETLWDTGIKLRCPVCEQGRLFDDWFNMHPLCPHCSVRFERYDGEVVGGMTISILATSFIFLTGYMVTEILYEWSIWVHLGIWVTFAISFPIIFYRYSRALWVALLHLAGDVHWDTEPYEEPNLSIIDAFLNKKPQSPARPNSDPAQEDDTPPSLHQ